VHTGADIYQDFDPVLSRGMQMSTQGQQQGSILSLASLMPKYQDMYTLQFQSRDSLTSKPRHVIRPMSWHAGSLCWPDLQRGLKSS
jgi:hypothetical protein